MIDKFVPCVTVWDHSVEPLNANTEFSCTPDRGSGCFTLCKKFVILHMLSYTGASLAALLFYSICRNYFEMSRHKRFPIKDSFCIN